MSDMSPPTPLLVDTAWLSARRDHPHLRIVDASYFVPGGIPEALAQYNAGHIPGAIFFNINDVATVPAAKEHAFPSAEVFAAKVGALGIGNRHHVVAYDHLGGALAAARVWFMFKAFGHDQVSLLDGGRTKWIAEGRPMTTDVPHLAPEQFVAKPATGRVVGQKDVLANIDSRRAQLLDARAAGRFAGTAPEPRAGLRGGHIPGSRNLPFLDLLDPDSKTWRRPEALKEAFAGAGIDLAQPLVTTCGSGVSACAVAFGAALAGKPDTVIYDGSWVEWGADPTAPLETGPAK